MTLKKMSSDPFEKWFSEISEMLRVPYDGFWNRPRMFGEVVAK